MAYDCCVAICHSLHYTNIMREELCISWGAMSWILPSVSALSHTLQLARLSFCANSTFPHFFCDLTALMKPSCSDISPNELVIFTVGTAVIPLPLIFILISYGCMEITISEISSTKGFCKVLPTCVSHPSVMSLYYGAIIGLYLIPSPSTSSDKEIVTSVMYSEATPLLKPFIYSIKN